jgi:membrane protein
MHTLLIHSIQNFSRHNNARFAAAIAYYMIFCLVPLLFIFTGIMGILLSDIAIEQALFVELQRIFGTEGAQFLQEHLQPAGGEKGVWISILGIVLSLFGTSAVFKELKAALDTIFDVPAKKQGSVSIVMHNLSTFFLLFATGMLISVSFLITLVFGIATPYFYSWLPEASWVQELLNFLLSFGLITTLFMFLYTFVPDTPVALRSTFVGSLFTAFCFTLGKTLFALYVGSVGFASGYGAASTLLILLLWLFYSAELFLLGAEITAQINKHFPQKKSSL